MHGNTTELPALTSTPARHPGCCLSLSTTLLERIVAVMSHSSYDGNHQTVLSVGSGSGLLEYLLLVHAKDLYPDQPLLVEGVEVQQPDSQPCVNKYLPEQHYHTVQRTSTISPRLHDGDVQALLFVYPRQPSLVSQYLGEISAGKTNVDTVIWLGPKLDWDTFSTCFDATSLGSGIQLLLGADAGLDDYELMAMVRLHRRGVDRDLQIATLP